MTRAQFEQFASRLLQRCAEVRTAKQQEYDTTDEMMNELKSECAFLGLDPIKGSWIFTKKHYDVLRRFIRTGKTGADGAETFEHRLVDAINWLLLLGALVSDAQPPSGERIK